MYLFDTNVIINFLDASFSPEAMQFLRNTLDDQCNISIITKIEALGFNFKTLSEERTMNLFIDNSIMLDINDDIANKTIAIRKSKKIRLPDAIIAATAMIYSFTLVTRNTSDFKNIDGLEIYDPWGTH